MSDDNRNDEVRGRGSRLLMGVLHRYFALSRGMTMGVRAACFDAEGRVFLVRHTYVPGWYLPGGGIERHETAGQALSKELREEGNLEMTGVPELFHIYYNSRVSKRDHVLLYRVNVIQTAPRPPDREIAECGFFDPLDLPDGATTATRKRLAELRGEITRSEIW